MEATLKACSDILQEKSGDGSMDVAVARLFLRLEQELMERGSAVQRRYAKDALAWIGDKKPVQQADPRIFSFVRQHFPNGRFIHIIRHPQMVVSSMVTASATWSKVAYWKEP